MSNELIPKIIVTVKSFGTNILTRLVMQYLLSLGSY